MISFFLHSVSANLMVAKKRGNARKTPEIVRFRGFEAMISFLASRYGCGRRIWTHTNRVRVCRAAITQFRNLAPVFRDVLYYSRQDSTCQHLSKKLWTFFEQIFRMLIWSGARKAFLWHKYMHRESIYALNFADGEPCRKKSLFMLYLLENSKHECYNTVSKDPCILL